MNYNSAPTPQKQVAYAYSRFSTSQQAEGDSLRRQQTRAKEWADARNCELEFIHDEGVSAYKGANRTLGQLGAFIDRLRSGLLGPRPIMLIENFDRLSRQEIEDAQGLFLELVNRGATVVTLHNGKVYRKPLQLVDIIVALVEMDLAHQESAKKAFRVAAEWEAARKRAAETKTPIHRKTTFAWLRQTERGFELIPERAELVRRIFALYLKGEGAVKIAARLNREGIPTWNLWGRQIRGWHGTQILNILRNRAVLGEFQPHRDVDGGKRREPVGLPIKGYFPPVFPNADIFNAAAAIRGVATRRGKPSRDEWCLVAGLVWSGLDGSRMWGQKGVFSATRSRPHYLKSHASIIGTAPQNHFLRYAEFEDRLLSVLRHMDPELLRRPERDCVSAQEEALKNARLQTEAAERTVAKYLRLIRDDDLPSLALVNELKAAERTLQWAKQSERRIRNRPPRTADRVEFDDEDLASPEGRRFVRAQIAKFCDRIVFYRDHFRLMFDEHEGLAVSLTGDLVCWPIPDPAEVGDRQLPDGQEELSA